VFRHPQLSSKVEGGCVYEDRVALIRADTADEAIEKPRQKRLLTPVMGPSSWVSRTSSTCMHLRCVTRLRSTHECGQVHFRPATTSTNFTTAVPSMSASKRASFPSVSVLKAALLAPSRAPSNYAFKPTAGEVIRFNQPLLAGGGLTRRWAA
jgi:hypothetical protein